MTPSPPDPSLPALLRGFSERLPPAGDRLNALLALPVNRTLHLAAVHRDTSRPAPSLSLDEWLKARDLLMSHEVFPRVVYQRRAGPEEYEPPSRTV